jgi:hypothetical protein
LLPDKMLQRQIADLKMLEQRCFASRQRFKFYHYLRAVYAFYAFLRHRNEARKTARRIVRLLGLCNRTAAAHPIRVIIDATSDADTKAKSRWARALQFAWHERKRSTKFQEVLLKYGGPAGCAEQFAALNSKPPQGCVRVGGEGRVPRIPLFVDAEQS